MKSRRPLTGCWLAIIESIERGFVTPEAILDHFDGRPNWAENKRAPREIAFMVRIDLLAYVDGRLTITDKCRLQLPPSYGQDGRTQDSTD